MNIGGVESHLMGSFWISCRSKRLFCSFQAWLFKMVSSGVIRIASIAFRSLTDTAAGSLSKYLGVATEELLLFWTYVAISCVAEVCLADLEE